MAWLQGKKGKKEKKPAAAAPAAAASSSADSEPTVAALDLRVGQIVKVGLHPNAEALYLEEIDVGEDKPRQVRLYPNPC
jgi:tRNA-binding EMAP/Myf-like protein